MVIKTGGFVIFNIFQNHGIVFLIYLEYFIKTIIQSILTDKM